MGGERRAADVEVSWPSCSPAGRGRSAASATSSPSSVPSSASGTCRASTAIDLLGALGGAATSPSPSASSRPLSGSRSSNSRNISRSRERSGSRAAICSRSRSDVDVADRRGELLRDTGVLGVVGQVLLALGAGDVVDVAEHALEVAVLLEQLRRGLVADPGDARDVVRGVALEADEVRDQLRRDAVAVDHGVAVVDLRLGDPAARGHHAHAGLDQLEEVAVAGHDHHVEALVAGPAGHRGDHVVGLVALHLHVLVAEAVDERLQVRPLLGEQVGLRVALALVLLVDLVAARHARVPDHQRGLHAVLGDDLHEHRGEAEDRVRWAAPSTSRSTRAARRTRGRRGCSRRSGTALGDFGGTAQPYRGIGPARSAAAVGAARPGVSRCSAESDDID